MFTLTLMTKTTAYVYKYRSISKSHYNKIHLSKQKLRIYLLRIRFGCLESQWEFYHSSIQWNVQTKYCNGRISTVFFFFYYHYWIKIIAISFQHKSLCCEANLFLWHFFYSNNAKAHGYKLYTIHLSI